jgi:A/G-specific adenine glycosylase
VQSYYTQHGRSALPWRKTLDPYAILVSEMMLQQTQVDRVIPYYERFLKRFPTVRDLAKAPLSEVLQLWSGLGYNRRARFLHEAAKAVVAQHAGVFPRSVGELEKLPGVGPYTARAVAIFAFDSREACIETNIRTVFLHHCFSGRENVPDSELMPLIAASIKDVKSPRQWYAALMDYGTHLKKTLPNPSRKSRHHSKQSPFEGSLRQVRGAIVRVLATTPATTHRLARESSYPVVRIEEALAQLMKDGLVTKQKNRWCIFEN